MTTDPVYGQIKCQLKTHTDLMCKNNAYFKAILKDNSIIYVCGVHVKRSDINTSVMLIKDACKQKEIRNQIVTQMLIDAKETAKNNRIAGIKGQVNCQKMHMIHTP